VFVPVLFLGGTTGRLFRELAAAMIGAVGVSLIVSLTLTPMMCSKMLKTNEKQSRFTRKTNDVLNRLSASYRRSLNRILERWVLVGATCFGILALTLFGLSTLHSELSPEEDSGLAFMTAVGPEGMSYDTLANIMFDVEKRVLSLVSEDGPVQRANMRAPGRWGATDDFSSGGATIVLRDWGDRDVSTQEVIQQIQAKMNDLPGMRVFTNQRSSLGGGADGRSSLLSAAPRSRNWPACATQLWQRPRATPAFRAWIPTTRKPSRRCRCASTPPARRTLACRSPRSARRSRP